MVINYKLSELTILAAYVPFSEEKHKQSEAIQEPLFV
jgi:hypothetical protein